MDTRLPLPIVTRRITLVGFDGVAALDLVGPLEVFATANVLFAREGLRPYDTRVLTTGPGLMNTSSGLRLEGDGSWRSSGQTDDVPDTLLVAGGQDVTPMLEDAEFIAWIRGQATRVRRIGSICTGAFVLAKAGLLNGKRATTHWLELQRLREGYPEVAVEGDAIFVRDGTVYTSAGISAGIDLALAMVEEDLGHRAAMDIARVLVLFMKRPGGQSQFSTRLRSQISGNTRLAGFVAWLSDNFFRPLTVEDMAAQAAMSYRTLVRVFARETGLTPARYLEGVRLEQAAQLLEDTTAAIAIVAQRCGFSSADRLRSAFQRRYKVSPQAYRERFSAFGRTPVADSAVPHDPRSQKRKTP